MQQQQRNPYIEPENYFEEYTKNIENLRNDPRIFELDRLAYELFEMNDVGKKYIELVKERYLYPALAQRGGAMYHLDVIWAEGFKDAYRAILMSLQSHKQRILAETK